MKKLILFMGITFVATSVFAQDSDQKGFLSRVSFGANLVAGYSGITDGSNHTSINSLGFVTYSNTEEAPRPGYGLGLWGSYQVASRWDLQLGVNYGHWRFFERKTRETFAVVGNLASFYYEQADLRQGLLQIPLEGRFSFGNKQQFIRPFIQLGLQASYLLDLRGTAQIISGSIGQEPVLQAFGEKADLQSERFERKRWQHSVLGGVGIAIGQATLSLQRNWAFTRNSLQESDYYDYQQSYCGITGLFSPSPNVRCPFSVRQFRQTSLRLSYLIF